MKAILSPLAEYKLDQLLKYLEAEWGNTAKKNFIQKFRSSILAIEKFPDAFPKSTVEFEIHKCVVTRQTSLIYRVNGEMIEIVTILDNRQDPEKLKEELRKHFL